MNGRRGLRRVVPLAAAFVVASSAAMHIAAGGSLIGGAPSGAPQATALPSPLDPGTWKTRAPTGIARQEVSYASVGKRFFLTGRLAAMQSYNPVRDTWKKLPDAPTDVDHIQAVVLGGKIYYIGGLVPSHFKLEVGTVHIYDPGTGTFSLGAPMPSGRERGAGGVVVYQGMIYYAGGLHGGASVEEFDRYDPGTDTWATMPSMPVARDHSEAALVGDRMYMIGGRDNGVTITDNVAFDFKTNQWVTGLASLPTPRGGFASAVVGDEILVIGGEAKHPNLVFGDVEAYDTVSDTWRTLAPMPTPVQGIQAVVWHGGVYIAAGGTTADDTSPTDVQEVLFPTSARPDAMIQLDGDASLLGSDTYDPAPGPTRSTSSTVGQQVVFRIGIQNDASVADRILVTAPGGSSSFDVTYLLDGVDVTASVTGSGLLLPTLGPGRSATLTLDVDATAPASSGSWTVAASSKRVPAIDDHVTAAVSVP